MIDTLPSISFVRATPKGERAYERVKIPFSSILYFKAEQKYVTAVTLEGHEHTLDVALKDLAVTFGDHLILSHRAYLVVIKHITGFNWSYKDSAGFVHLFNGVSVPVSRRGRKVINVLLHKDNLIQPTQLMGDNIPTTTDDKHNDEMRGHNPIFNKAFNPNHYTPQVDEPSPFGKVSPNAWVDWHRAGNKSQLEINYPRARHTRCSFIFLEEVGKSLLYEPLRTSEQIGDEPSLMTNKGTLSMAWVIWAYYVIAFGSWEKTHAVGNARIDAL